MSLASASADNAQIEGDDAATDTATATTRFGNYLQIFRKVPRVSRTLRSVSTAGRADELSYQIAGTSATVGESRQMYRVNSRKP